MDHGTQILACNLVVVEPRLPLLCVVKELQEPLVGHVPGQLSTFRELLVSGPTEDERVLVLVPVEGGEAHHHLLDKDLSLEVLDGE